MKYFSVMYATSNEHKLKEVQFSYEKTFWQWLFFRPATTERWMGGSVWYNAETGESASLEKLYEIHAAITSLKYKSLNP